MLVCVALFLVNHLLNKKISHLNEKIKQSERQFAIYNKKATQVDVLKEELNKLNNKLKVIGSLKNGRKFSINTLKEISDLTVENRMWLKSLKFNKKSISFAGIAIDDKTVADFMRNLEESSMFKDVELKSVSRTEVNSTDLRQFSMRAKIIEQKKK